MKSLITENMIEEAQAYGWMLDFGEYTPFDVQTYSKQDPFKYHNSFPLEWAKINREAEIESGKGDEIVAFMRSGSTMSP